MAPMQPQNFRDPKGPEKSPEKNDAPREVACYEPIPDPPLVFFQTETDLSKALGLPRDAVRTFRVRELAEGHDFALVGKQITYTEAAALKVQTHFAPKEIEVEKPTPPVVVLGVHCRLVKTTANPFIVMATLVTDGVDGPLVRVRVTRSLNWIPGMQLPVEKESDDLYRCTHPAPRLRGRW